jgi:hypothetical protein
MLYILAFLRSLGYNIAMEFKDTLKSKFTQKPQKSKQMHTPAHLLAAELSSKFNEPKRFGFYLKMALTYDNNILRRIAGEVLESSATKNPGALFSFLVKKNFAKE